MFNLFIFKQDYIKKQFGDELAHDALFDEPHSTSKFDKNHLEKKYSNRKDKFDVYSDSFDSDDSGSSPSEMIRDSDNHIRKPLFKISNSGHQNRHGIRESFGSKSSIKR